MSFDKVGFGSDVPDEFHTIIEIPANSGAVKYEVDKASGTLFVDRFMSTAMFYPCNYGYVPNTLSEDGDPADVLVITPSPLISGSVVKVRPIAVLKMTDEAGSDAKILAVPTTKLSSAYEKYRGPDDVAPHLLMSIVHFFEHYKDLEEGKWVRVDGWGDADAAKEEIQSSIVRYAEKP